MNNYNLIQDAFKVLKRQLCDKGHYDKVTMYLFSHDKLSEKDARSIIGLENWSNDNPNQVDVTTTLLHDVAGLFNDDEWFVPRCSSYEKFYREEVING